ncbi:type III effector, partial [Vibrio parahaemolyticus]
DVQLHPENNDLQNIRNIMVTGWEGLQFETSALTAK